MIDPPRVALVGCGKAKKAEPAAALHLYTGRLFRASVDFATATHDETFIVSAKHGLVRPETILRPYEHSIADEADPASWGRAVVRDLQQAMSGAPIVVTLLMGNRYSRWIVRAFAGKGIRFTEPLTGIRGMGPRIVRLQEMLAEAGGLPR